MGERKGFFIAAILLATAAVYLQTVGFGWVQIDDPHHLFENPAFQPPSLSSTLRFWIDPFFGMFIPFTYTVWQAVGALAMTPAVFHFLNFALHAANTTLVFRLLSIRFGSVASLLGALAFCFHPVQAESVAWISATKDLLFSLTLLLAIYAQSAKRFNLSHLFFFLSLCSKPTAVIGPMILLLFHRLFLESNWKESIRRAIPWTLMTLPFIFIAKFLQPEFLVKSVVALKTRPLIAMDTIGFYLKKVLFPVGLALDYGRTPTLAIEQGLELIPFALYLMTLVFLIAKRRRFPLALLGALWFVVGFLPVSGLIPFQYQVFSTVADRYLYFSMVGFGILVADLTQRTRIHYIAPIVLMLGILGFQQTRTWSSNPALFDRALRANPQSYLANNNYAFYLFTKGEYSQARHYFKQTVDLKPDEPFLRMNYALTLIQLGETENALREMRVAKRLSSSPFPPSVSK